MKIKTYSVPKNSQWIVADGEKILFDETICLLAYKTVSIDSVITSEITGLISEENPVTAYNTYRLYIDDSLVCVSGFEAERDVYAPNLASCNLTWGGSLSCRNKTNIKITAQLTQINQSDNIISSNVMNNMGQFQGSKGAYMKVFTF